MVEHSIFLCRKKNGPNFLAIFKVAQKVRDTLFSMAAIKSGGISGSKFSPGKPSLRLLSH